MELIDIFATDAAFRSLMRTAGGICGLTALAMIAIMVLHTLHLLGNKTFLYRKRSPAEGWSKRFYPACALLIISLSVVMWLLNVWSHTT